MDRLPATGLGGIIRVALLHLVDAKSELGWPCAAVIIAFVPNALGLWATSETVREPVDVTGLLALYILVFVSFLAAMTQWFPFALSLGITRKRFFTGISLLAVAQGAAFSAGLVILLAIEQTTGGWGLDMGFFGPEAIVAGNPGLQFLVYLVPMVMISYLGMVWGIIAQRWGRTGLITASSILFVASAGASTAITWLDAWSEVSAALSNQSPAALLAGWMALVAAILGAATYTLLRRSMT